MSGPEPEPEVMVHLTVAVRTSAGPGPGPKSLPAGEAARLIADKRGVYRDQPPQGYLGSC